MTAEFILWLVRVNGVVDADPDVEEAEAGDDAADGSVEEDHGEVREEEQVVVIGPEMGPGERDDEEAEIDADDDAHGELKELEPVSRTRRRRLDGTARRRALRWRAGRWGRGILWRTVWNARRNRGSVREQSRLLAHAVSLILTAGGAEVAGEGSRARRERRTQHAWKSRAWILMESGVRMRTRMLGGGVNVRDNS